MRRITAITAIVAIGLIMSSSGALSQQALAIKPLAEKKVTQLPAGPLFWRVENFGTLSEAQAAAGPMALAVEAAGKGWLFTLGSAGGRSAGGTKVADIGPIPAIAASEYLLRVNDVTGTPGSVTPVHSHPGSESFYVISGELSQKTARGLTRLTAGESMAGHGGVGNMPMQVSNTGSVELHEFALFVVDAGKPFSSPATFSDAETGH